ncbi:hypothetical protein DXG03_008013, partial [Asterophora parasitica]
YRKQPPTSSSASATPRPNKHARQMSTSTVEASNNVPNPKRAVSSTTPVSSTTTTLPEASPLPATRPLDEVIDPALRTPQAAQSALSHASTTTPGLPASPIPQPLDEGNSPTLRTPQAGQNASNDALRATYELQAASAPAARPRDDSPTLRTPGTPQSAANATFAPTHELQAQPTPAAHPHDDTTLRSPEIAQSAANDASVTSTPKPQEPPTSAARPTDQTNDLAAPAQLQVDAGALRGTVFNLNLVDPFAPTLRPNRHTSRVSALSEGFSMDSSSDATRKAGDTKQQNTSQSGTGTLSSSAAGGAAPSKISVAASALFKASKNSCSELNLFGMEYCKTHPKATKVEVKLALDALSSTERQHWKDLRAEKLSAKKDK